MTKPSQLTLVNLLATMENQIMAAANELVVEVGEANPRSKQIKYHASHHGRKEARQ